MWRKPPKKDGEPMKPGELVRALKKQAREGNIKTADLKQRLLREALTSAHTGDKDTVLVNFESLVDDHLPGLNSDIDD